MFECKQMVLGFVRSGLGSLEGGGGGGEVVVVGVFLFFLISHVRLSALKINHEAQIGMSFHKLWNELQQTNRSWQHTKCPPNRSQNVPGKGSKRFCLLTRSVTLKEGQGKKKSVHKSPKASK